MSQVLTSGVRIYVRIYASKRKISEGVAAPVRAKTSSLHYYLIRALTRVHESAKLYYEPESYTRALAMESIHTRLILLPHIILTHAHGRLTLLRIAKSQMIQNKVQMQAKNSLMPQTLYYVTCNKFI